jgi:hypothetical protein
MLAEESTADIPDEELVEWRERLTRLLTVIATTGGELDDDSIGERA